MNELIGTCWNHKSRLLKMNFACSQKVKYSKSIHLHSNPYRFEKPASPCNEMDHAVLCGGLRAIDSQWNHTLSELSGKWDYLNDANLIMKLFNFISHPSHLVCVVSFRFVWFGFVTCHAVHTVQLSIPSTQWHKAH